MEQMSFKSGMEEEERGLEVTDGVMVVTDDERG